MHQDAEVPASSSAVAAADLGLDQLSRDLGSEGRWDELVVTLIERASASDVAERIGCLRRASSIYETKLRDLEKAYITLQAALSEDYRNEDTFRELERVAGADRRALHVVHHGVDPDRFRLPSPEEVAAVRRRLGLGTMQPAARRSEVRVQARKKRALTGECSSGSVKKVASCNVTTVATRLASGIV